MISGLGLHIGSVPNLVNQTPRDGNLPCVWIHR